MLVNLDLYNSNNIREDSAHGHHQMVNTEIRLIIFLAAEDGEASSPRYARIDTALEPSNAMIFSLFVWHVGS